MDLSNSIDDNIAKFKADFTDCSDFLIREIETSNVKMFVAIMDGLIDSLQLSQMVVSPLLDMKIDENEKGDLTQIIKSSVLYSVELKDAKTYNDCYYYLMSGFAVIVIDGYDKALVCGIQGWEKRGVDESSNESTVRAAKESFIESLNDNKALIRKRIKSHHLKIKQLKLGTSAPTSVAVAYIDDRANKNLVDKIIDDLYSANLSTILDYGEIIPFIDTNIDSLFSAVANTERPDVAVSKLYEGRVLIFIDGSPFVLYTPSLFTDNFQSPDDYDTPSFYAALIRILRYFSFVMSIFLPGVYVAIGTFHQELIPTTLLFTIAKEEITAPYSLTTEALMLLILYEIMREAGLRLPKAVGHAVSIIGGIVIGETTVSAGLIGAPMLVVIALTAISSYVVSSLYESVSVLRFVFIVIGGLTGMYGIILGAAILCVNICALNPYGVIYSSPISPLDINSLGDIFYRETWLKLSKKKFLINNLRGADIDESVIEKR